MAFGPKRLLPTQMRGTLWDPLSPPPSPLVGSYSGNRRQAWSPCLMEAAAGFLMTRGCPVPTSPPQTPGRKLSLDGKEEMPSGLKIILPPVSWDRILGRTLGMNLKSDPLCVLEGDSLPSLESISSCGFPAYIILMEKINIWICCRPED